MNIKDIIDIIPSLFLYFIPGYITIYIKQLYRHDKEQKESHVVIMSVVISFIIKTISSTFFSLINQIFNKNLAVNQDLEALILLVLSILTGYIWVKYNNSKIELKVNKLFNSSTKSEANVWNYAMRSQNGGWVRVYLHNENRIYIGKLINYTIDPNEKDKEILISSYSSYELDTEKELEDYDDDNKLVLIKCNDIRFIEILKD